MAALDGLPSSEALPTEYDPDVFESMAVVNSEVWNKGEEDERLTREDILPHGTADLTPEALGVAFLQAAQAGVLDAVEELSSHCGPQILLTTDADQYTALHRASYNGHVKVVEFLLEKGAMVNSRTVDGWTPLHSACRWNKAKVASILLQNGALINSKTNGGQTPLHLAACNDQAKATLELLLNQKDLDVSLTNTLGETARELAERNGRWAFLFHMTDEAIDYRKFATQKKTT